MVLVVLSTLGISVALMSQTEFLIGGAERMVHRTFYAADSGVAASTTKALVAADFAAATFAIPDVGNAAALGIRQQVDLSPFLPILETPCNLCEINNVGTYNEKSYRAINYAITATANRVRVTGTRPLAQSTVGSIVEVQPWKTSPEAFLPIDDPAQLEKIRF